MAALAGLFIIIVVGIVAIFGGFNPAPDPFPAVRTCENSGLTAEIHHDVNQKLVITCVVRRGS